MQNKIIYVGPFRFPIGDAAAARVLNNAKIFRKLGYEISFVSWGGSSRACDRSTDNSYYYQGFKYINTNEIDLLGRGIIYCLYNHIFAGRYSLNLLKTYLDNNTACVIIYNTPLWFNKRIIALCKKKHIKLISDITEWYSSEELPGGRFGLSAFLNNLNMMKMQYKIQNKIVISRLLNNYYDKSNNIIIPPLVDLKDSKWSNVLIELPLAIRDFDGIKFIYAGSPGRKDLLHVVVDTILKLMNEKYNLQFIIIGLTSDDFLRNGGNAEIMRYKNNIIFLGRISQDLIPAYYKQTDFSILLRNTNRKTMAGFPTKVVESMASGVPVITNYTSDIKIYIDDGQNGIIVNEPSSDSLYDTLRNKVLVKSRDEIEMIKKACLEKGKQFDFLKYTQEVDEFVKNLK